MGYILDAMRRGPLVRPGAEADPPPPFETSGTAVAEAPQDEADDVVAELPDNDRKRAGPRSRSSAPTPDPEVSGAATERDAEPTWSRSDNRIHQVVDASEVDERLVALTNPASVMAEEYRAVRTSILARWEQKRNLAHTITSATPQEGKTITSLNLGLSFAELRNRRTVVIEADLRLPQFARQLGLAETPGLVALLEGKQSTDRVVCRVDQSNLDIIPAGQRANDRAVQLLSSTAMESLIVDLRRQYDHVIIDTPPVVELADAGILGALSDEVLLIARIGRTPRKLIQLAVRTLGSYSAHVSGLIATDQKYARRRYYYKYGYGYRYGYRYGYHRYQQQS